MKIFISSLIGGFEEFRAAARSAINTLRHEAVVAEEFGARPDSPQISCLQGVRSADLVVLILGARYGYPQGSSGVSPTHEEFLEARGRKPILVFVQEDVEREQDQAQFINEVSAWQAGHFRAGFKKADQLRDLVTRAIHDYQLATAAGPLDMAALSAAALHLLPPLQRNSSGSPALLFSIAAGPLQTILRPAQLEAPALQEAIHQRALFVEPKLFSTSKGVDSRLEGNSLVLDQPQGAKVQIHENGSVFLRLGLNRSKGRARNGFASVALAVIEEDVLRELSAALAFGAWLLEEIDPTQRVTHVALAASIEASDYMGWRTQAEQDASPNSGTIRASSSQQRPTSSTTTKPRMALKFQAPDLAEDLMVSLRRQMKS